MQLTKEQIEFLNKVVKGVHKTTESGFEEHCLSWKLNSNGEVDVDGSVNMYYMNLTEIPVKFGSVNRSFNCSYNQLKSLKNAPKSVGGYFDCSDNQLTSLEFAPTSVRGDFSCYNNQLTSLEGCPTSVGRDFYCVYNNLTNYFKNIKEEDFPHWDKLNWCVGWWTILDEYPFLINIAKKYITKDDLKMCLNKYPQTKIYLE